MARIPPAGLISICCILSALAGALWDAPESRADEPDPAADPASVSLAWIDGLYRSGDRFRAESEILRFSHDYPGHPRRDEVELVRAKLYYREGRYREGALMLYSLLDRFPDGAAAEPATLLLGFSLVRDGQTGQAAGVLRFSGLDAERMAALSLLSEPGPDVVDPDSAVAWSTWLPGSGFFLLGQPGKATAAISLNVLFTAGTVLAYQQENFGVALVLLLVEVALYTGGRGAVRDEAERLARQAETRRRLLWTLEAGEGELLEIGLRVDFGGS